MTQLKDKKLYLEALRIVCIFLVAFNHSAPNGYLAFIGKSNPFLYFLYLFLSVLCKIAVPCFFMISGALLIGKQEPLCELYKKRVLRIAIVLLLISIPNYVLLTKDAPLSVVGFFRTIYTSTARTALWYLYSYLAFLIMLPFLRAMAVQMKETDYKYLLALHVVLSVALTALDRFVFLEGHNPYISAAIALEPCLFYPLMGYYVEHVLDSRKFAPKYYRLAIAISVVAVAITCAVSMLYYRVRPIPLDNDGYQTCFEILICIPAIALYFVFKGAVSIRSDSRFGRFVALLGSAVFGLYLIENFCRMLASPVYRALAPAIGSFPATIVQILTAMTIGFAVVLFLKNTPYLKKVVNQLI